MRSRPVWMRWNMASTNSNILPKRSRRPPRRLPIAAGAGDHRRVGNRAGGTVFPVIGGAMLARRAYVLRALAETRRVPRQAMRMRHRLCGRMAGLGGTGESHSSAFMRQLRRNFRSDPRSNAVGTRFALQDPVSRATAVVLADLRFWQRIGIETQPHGGLMDSQRRGFSYLPCLAIATTR